MKKVAIIGGGASGSLLTANLLRTESRTAIGVALIDKRDRVGRGVAYSTDKDVHLLNVPANKMGAFPDDVEHFHRWLLSSGLDYEPTAFVPRKLFGQYLNEILSAATVKNESGFELVDDEAVDITETGDSFEVELASGRKLAADVAVLAFGNFPPPHPSVPDLSFISHPRYHRNPWNSEFYSSLNGNESVFIIGTGLSMVDVVLQLDRTQHQGMITAISTRGLLPAVHRLGFSYPSFTASLETMRLITDIQREVRRNIKAAGQNGSDWRAVIDSLRPTTQGLWQNLPIAEKQYFRQHLSRYWNVARHRMPPEAAETLDRLRRDGKFEVLKGRLTDIRVDGGVFRITYSHLGETHQARAERLVNCIGSESDFRRIEAPLVQRLLEKGLIAPDALRLGLNATPEGRIIGRDGHASPRLFTLGTALKGILWESTAIPEIRSQARDLAKLLLAE